MIFLIAAELVSRTAGAIAGFLAAFSPQFAWNSVLLLPDAISVLPVLVAIYLIARAVKNPGLWTFLVAGMLLGVSCWLRANLMLLTFFVALAVLLPVSTSGRNEETSQGKWRFALAVVCGTLLIVLPLTIRNAIVFHRFIPLSLGAGQTLLEGIADYDTEGKFGIPRTDVGIMKQEAEIYARPDYYGTLFNPDGVERERARLSRGFAVIGSHPLWFAGVMARRASSMVRMERSRLIATDHPVTHSITDIERIQPVWSESPHELSVRGSTLSSQTRTSLTADKEDYLAIAGDGSSYGDQFAAPSQSVIGNYDYVITAPIEVTSGRIRMSVRSSSGKVCSSTIVEAVEMISPNDQPAQQVFLPFVAPVGEQVRLVFSNEASNPPNPTVLVGRMKLYELGPARFLWTRYPRFVIRGIQKIFLTAVILPLAIAGLLILIFQMQSRALMVLSIVPVYFFAVQSIVHTEYRYVLAVDYFLFAFAGVAIAEAGRVIKKFRRPSP